MLKGEVYVQAYVPSHSCCKLYQVVQFHCLLTKLTDAYKEGNACGQSLVDVGEKIGGKNGKNGNETTYL